MTDSYNELTRLLLKVRRFFSKDNDVRTKSLELINLNFPETSYPTSNFNSQQEIDDWVTQEVSRIEESVRQEFVILMSSLIDLIQQRIDEDYLPKMLESRIYILIKGLLTTLKDTLDN
jgi:hypothetical protein